MRFLAIVAMSASLLMAGCEKEENGDSTGGGNNNGGGNNAEWVDLGLPSGLLWASCNVGATAPEEYGDYFAWGETTTKSNYDLSTYAYGNDWTQLTKYCTDSEYGLNGFTDNLTTLQSSDDAAAVNMGGGARTPTYDEWNELIDNTTAEWTTLNGVNGRKFTAPNGKSIFLPAAGFRNGSEFDDAGSQGVYWSSSLNADRPSCVWFFNFASGGQEVANDCGRDFGNTVRAVRQN